MDDLLRGVGRVAEGRIHGVVVAVLAISRWTSARPSWYGKSEVSRRYAGALLSASSASGSRDACEQLAELGRAVRFCCSQTVWTHDRVALDQREPRERPVALVDDGRIERPEVEVLVLELVCELVGVRHPLHRPDRLPGPGDHEQLVPFRRVVAGDLAGQEVKRQLADRRALRDEPERAEQVLRERHLLGRSAPRRSPPRGSRRSWVSSIVTGSTSAVGSRPRMASTWSRISE